MRNPFCLVIAALGSLFLWIPTVSGQITGIGAANAVSRLNGGRADSRIGNSVDTGTGAYVVSKQLLSVMGARNIVLSLTNNSLLTGNGGETGYGWSHNYEAFIDGDPLGTVTVHWDVNSKNSFRFAGTGAPYEPLDAAVRYDKLTRAVNGHWTLTRMDGTIFTFTQEGLLATVGNKIRQTISLTRPRDRISEIDDAYSERKIFLRYTRDGKDFVQAITDQEDRIVHIDYDGADRIEAIRGPVTLDLLEHGTFFAPKNIPDNDLAGVIHTIQVTRSEPIGLVELSLANLSHARPSDLRVVLTSPSGTQAVFENTVPNPTAAVGLNAWDLTSVVLAEFDGENPEGEWRVRAIDSASGSVGQLNGWRMRFTEPADPIRYTYDAAGRITASFGPDGERLFTNTYDGLGRVISQDDGVDTNVPATFAYLDTPSGGVQTTYRDRLGAAHVFEHDAQYRLLSYTNPLGETNLYGYNSQGDRTRFTNPLGRTTLFNYDINGNLITLVDAGGFVTTFSYDERNNLTQVRDALGKQSTFSYDSSNNLTRVVDALGHQDQKIYGGASQITGNILHDGAGINYSYSNGMPVAASHPVSGTARSEYDEVGRPTQMVDPDGYRTGIRYDSKGNVIAETDAQGFVIESVFDRRNRLVRKIDRRGNSTRYAYDNNGNLLSVTNALGQIVRFEYDGEDRQIAVINPNGARTEIHYDLAGRIIREVDALGNTLTHQYDAAGNQIAVLDAAGVKVQQTGYDDRGLPVVETDAFGNTRMSNFDPLGRLTQTTDPLQRNVRFSYDALDRLTEVRDPLNRTSRKGYVSDDVVSGLTNPRNASTAFSYDQANRIRQVSTPNGRRTSFTYNGRDLINRETKPSGVVHNYTYDEVGRLTRIDSTGSGAIVPQIHFDYDDNGNLTTVSRRAFSDIEPVPRLRRTYDVLDRLTSFTDGSGNIIQFRYDAVGNVRELVYPDGRSVIYGYDAADRMTSVTDWAGRITRYTYDANSRITGIAFPNKTSRTMEYDVAGRVIRRRDLDAVGGVIVEYKFSYDAASQLAIELSSSRGLTSPPTVATMTFDNDNRLSSFNGQSVSFDADGNLTRGPLVGGFADFRYDFNQNLIEAGASRYVYDEEDRLISIITGTQQTRFVVNPGAKLSQILVKTDPNGRITRYVYGVGLLYEEIDGGQTRTLHYDQRGSTVALTGDAGNIVGSIEYGPYGEVLRTSGQSDTMFRFGGMFGVITDSQGLNYMRFRWYSPTMKRFLTADAHYGDITDAGSLNRYAYAGGSPASRIDPQGEFWHIIAGAIGGAVVGTVVKLVTDLADDGQINAPWQEYVGAAVGGAVTGGLIAACPTCGLAAGVLFSGAGGAAENATTQGLKLATGEQQQFDLADFGIETGISAAFGFLPAGRGAKAAVKAKPQGFKNAAKNAFRFKFEFRKFKKVTIADRVKIPPGVPIPVPKTIRVPVTARDAFRDVFHKPALMVDFLTGLIEDVTIDAATAQSGGKRQIETTSLREVNANHRGSYGEFAHWQTWLDALELAARPAPNNPNNLLTAF